MPHIACTCTEAPSSSSLTARARTMLRKIALALAVRAERRALMSLDQGTMKDLGFSNSQAYREYGRSFWDVPCDRLRL